MIKGVYLTYNDNLGEVLSIRSKVFTTELNIPAEIENDGEDIMAMHVLLEHKDEYVGTGRMRYDGETFILDKLAVLPEHRKNGFGEFIIRMLLDKVFLADGKEIYADVLPNAKSLFEEIGFIENGATYEKDGLTYTPMIAKKGQIKTKCGHK